MALPSQTAREVMGPRSHSGGLTRRAARRNVRLLVLAVLVVAGCLGYAGWSVLVEPAPTQASDGIAASPSPVRVDQEGTRSSGLHDGTGASGRDGLDEDDGDPADNGVAHVVAMTIDDGASTGDGTSASMKPAGVDGAASVEDEPGSDVVDPIPGSADPTAGSADSTPEGEGGDTAPSTVAGVTDPVDEVMPDGEGDEASMTEPSGVGRESSPTAIDAGLVTEAPGVAPNPIEESLAEARRHANAGRSIQARVILSRLLATHGDALKGEVEATVMRQVNRLGERLLASRGVVAGDPLTQHYDVPAGDTFGKIGRRFKVPYPLIMQVNGIEVDTSLRAGQQIKVVRGPFHAVITKHAYRMDIFAEDDSGRRLFVACLDVGLGADDSTPSGQWIVCRGKQHDPDWRNPRTNRYYAASDPENPIGEYWIPLEGVDEQTRGLDRYGIHGTIDPDSIGRQASMGCVRLRPEDIRRVYHMLAEEHSQVKIRE